MAAEWNMIGRMRHDLAVRLLAVRVFNERNRFVEIEQRLQFITAKN
jgi:hypothetical protein